MICFFHTFTQGVVFNNSLKNIYEHPKIFASVMKIFIVTHLYEATACIGAERLRYIVTSSNCYMFGSSLTICCLFGMISCDTRGVRNCHTSLLNLLLDIIVISCFTRFSIRPVASFFCYISGLFSEDNVAFFVVEIFTDPGTERFELCYVGVVTDIDTTMATGQETLSLRALDGRL